MPALRPAIALMQRRSAPDRTESGRRCCKEWPTERSRTDPASSRRCHEIERMPAIAAEIFVVTATTFREIEKVPGKQADRGMFDLAAAVFFLQEGMPAVAGVFMQPISRRHPVNTVPEQIAQVSDFFRERRPGRIGIAVHSEQQRMPALNTGILVVTGT